MFNAAECYVCERTDFKANMERHADRVGMCWAHHLCWLKVMGNKVCPTCHGRGAVPVAEAKEQGDAKR